VIAQVMANTYYPSREAYLYALADAMRDEYKAIVAAGFMLQVDCPDLAMDGIFILLMQVSTHSVGMSSRT